MVDITILNGVHKPTYNWGPHFVHLLLPNLWFAQCASIKKWMLICDNVYIYIYSYTYMCAHPQKLSFSMTSLITEIYTYWNGPREVSLRGPVLYVQKFIGSAVSNTSYFHVGVFDSLCLKWFAEPPTLEMYILCLHIILYIHVIYEYIYIYIHTTYCRYVDICCRVG